MVPSEALVPSVNQAQMLAVVNAVQARMEEHETRMLVQQTQLVTKVVGEVVSELVKTFAEQQASIVKTFTDQTKQLADVFQATIETVHKQPGPIAPIAQQPEIKPVKPVKPVKPKDSEAKPKPKAKTKPISETLRILATALTHHNTQEGVVAAFQIIENDTKFLVLSPLSLGIIASCAGVKVTKKSIKDLVALLESNGATASSNGSIRLGMNKPGKTSSRFVPMTNFKIREDQLLKLTTEVQHSIANPDPEAVSHAMDTLMVNLESGRLPAFYRKNDPTPLDTFGDVHTATLMDGCHTTFGLDKDLGGMARGAEFNDDQASAFAAAQDERREKIRVAAFDLEASDEEATEEEDQGEEKDEGGRKKRKRNASSAKEDPTNISEIWQ